MYVIECILRYEINMLWFMICMFFWIVFEDVGVDMNKSIVFSCFLGFIGVVINFIFYMMGKSDIVFYYVSYIVRCN